MKNLILLLLVFTACTDMKTAAPVPVADPDDISMVDKPGAFNPSMKKLLLKGNFTNGGHPTSGVASVYEDDMGVKTLVFENFKTDAGPDLRIYMATDKRASGFIEISKKVENGNWAYTLPAEWDMSKQNQVLIWCRAFSVLFGSAELK